MTRFDVFHFWARPYMVPPLYTILPRHHPWDLKLLKRFGKKIVFQSDGCYPMVRPSVWKTAVDPEICHVCQTTQGDTYGFCSNANTIRLNEAMDRYADLRFGMGLDLDFEKSADYVFAPVDVERWNPQIEVPEQHRFKRKRPGSVLIYHAVGSHVIGNRGNIKGTDKIIAAVDKLQRDGLNVELMHIERVPNDTIRFYQVQADIVVDQLLIGGGGANARESLAVGKPVLTRVHPQQLEAFKTAAAPHKPPPFIETDRHNLEENLVRLVRDPHLRARIGKESGEFAAAVLSPRASAERYVAHYRRLFAKPSTSGVGSG